MNGLVAVGGLGLGGLLTLAFLAGIRTKPSVLLARVEHELAALRGEVADYRTAHEYQAASLERRLDDLEQTAARAANELRMASDQMVARLPVEQVADNRGTA